MEDREEKARNFCDYLMSILGCGCCGGESFDSLGMEGVNELRELAQGVPEIKSYKFLSSRSSRVVLVDERV